MITGVKFVEPYVIGMGKKVWGDRDLSLAKCMDFFYDPETNVILVDLRMTSKKALHIFLTTAFRPMMENLDEVSQQQRHLLFEEIKQRYNELYTEFHYKLLSKLPYHEQLYNHQKDGLFQMVNKKYNLLSFEQGLGKTGTAASISRMLNIKRTVILCPVITKWNWFRDLTDPKLWGFNPQTFTVLDPSRKKVLRAFQERFIIINFDSAAKWVNYIKDADIGHIIIDECHNIKNIHSDRYKVVASLVEHFPDARVTLLSGTPIKNRVNDLFAYLKLTGHPLGGNYTAFLRDYAVLAKYRGGSVVKGSKGLDELYDQISNFIIRRRKDECTDIPDKVYFKCYFEMEDYRSEYFQVLNDMEHAKGMAAMRSNILSLSKIMAKAKVKGIKMQIDELIEQGRKVVVFSSFRDPLNMLEEIYGDACVKIDGSVSSEKRDDRISKFLNDDSVMVFLGNMVAAGVGINLVNSSDVIFMNFPLTPADLWQAIDRLHRIGQTNKVNVYYSICRNSVDEHIYALIEEKSRDINITIDKGEGEEIVGGEITEMLYAKLFNKEKIEADDIEVRTIEEGGD